MFLFFSPELKTWLKSEKLSLASQQPDRNSENFAGATWAQRKQLSGRTAQGVTSLCCETQVSHDSVPTQTSEKDFKMFWTVDPLQGS